MSRTFILKSSSFCGCLQKVCGKAKSRRSIPQLLRFLQGFFLNSRRNVSERFAPKRWDGVDRGARKWQVGDLPHRCRQCFPVSRGRSRLCPIYQPPLPRAFRSFSPLCRSLLTVAVQKPIQNRERPAVYRNYENTLGNHLAADGRPPYRGAAKRDLSRFWWSIAQAEDLPCFASRPAARRYAKRKAWASSLSLRTRQILASRH